MNQHAEAALPAEGSVLITTACAGGTAFTSAAKPKSRATADTSVMRLGFITVEIEIVYNMYRMHWFATIAVCAGC
jgi:hypothetical protein